MKALLAFIHHNNQISGSSLRPAFRLFCAGVALVLFAGASQVQAQTVFIPTLTNFVWSVRGGIYADLPADANSTVRGIALSPLTTNVLYASRTSSNHVSTMSFAGGAFQGTMQDGLSGGTLALVGVRVAGDGTVYACNLSGSPASDFKIYKWSSDTDFATAPVTVYDSGAGTAFQWRCGDYIDLRGSGSNTEIVAVGNGSGANITTNFVIFRPTDNTCTLFTNFTITIPGGAVNLCGAGVAFEGTNDAIWIRQAGSASTRRVAYSTTTFTATVTGTYTTDVSACQGLKYYSSTNGVQLLATVQVATGLGAAQIARVFQIPATGTALQSVMSSNLPAVSTGNNANGLGNVDAQNGFFAFGAPGNGVSLYKLGFITTAPPQCSAAETSATIIAGYNEAMTCTASGSNPLSYQWYFNTNTPVTGATNSVFTITNIQTANDGVYSVIVTNLYGSATSYLARVTVLPNGASLMTTQIWSLATGSQPYLDTSDAQRGLAYDPVSDQLVLVSRSPSLGVHLLNAETGADQGVMDVSGLSLITPPGTYPLNVCGVADDGAVYACDLLTSATSDNFAIYGWSSASPTASIYQAYVGNPGIGRIGDVMAVRGAGVNTEILCPFRTGTNVALFTTLDGVNFTFNLIAITNLPSGAQSAGFAGLGLAFGPGNTFWAKSSAFDLRQVSFDPVNGVGGVMSDYPDVPGSETAIGVDNGNGYIAAIGVTEYPQSLVIYDALAAGGPSLTGILDRKFFPTSNANANGIGAVAVDATGGRVFTLDTDNGIIALQYAGRLSMAASDTNQVVSWPTATSTLQSAPAVTGPYTDVSGATNPYTNNTGALMFYRLRH